MKTLTTYFVPTDVDTESLKFFGFGSCNIFAPLWAVCPCGGNHRVIPASDCVGGFIHIIACDKCAQENPNDAILTQKYNLWWGDSYPNVTHDIQGITFFTDENGYNPEDAIKIAALKLGESVMLEIDHVVTRVK